MAYNRHSGFILPTTNAIQTNVLAGNTALFQAYDVNSTTYRTLITMTANNDVTLDIAYLNSMTAVANIDIGSFDLKALTLTSDVADGTAPIVVASTTLVTNLNAEHWNSKHLGAVTDTKLVRYNSTGTQLETGTVAEVAGALSLITTLGMGGDLTNYENLNDGSPEFRLGSADAEELHIQSVYDAGAKTLDYVLFQTDVVSATADKGQFKFNVDGTEILRIDDGGIEVVGTVMATLGFIPDADDGAYLGLSGTAFSDLFLASGAVINFNAGNATITHSAGILTFNVFPVTPSSAPDADYEVANKKYVDDSTAAINSLSEILALGNTTGANNIVVSDTQAINTGIVDDDYFTIGAVDNDTNLIVEVARVQGAAEAYFSTGASQQFKFYSSGTALFGSLVTSDAATIEIGAGGVIKSGATNADTLLIAANDTTFITLTTGATDTLAIAAVTLTGVVTFDNAGAGADPSMVSNNAGQVLTLTGTFAATGFSGPLTGDVTGNVSGTAATVTGAAQTNITSLGTLTALSVDNITINTNDISSTAGNLTLTPVAGSAVIIDSHWSFDGLVMTAITDNNTTINAYAGKNITIESVTFDGGIMGGITSLGVTGARVTDGFFTSLAVTNTITGSINGNAATVTNLALGGGSLTLDGADALTLRTTAATDITLPTTGTLATLAGAETLSTKLIKVTAAPASDHLVSGTIITLTAHDAQAFGDVCFINSDGEAALADASVIASASAVVMCADATIDANAPGNYLMTGIANHTAWNWTVGGLIYLTITGTTTNTLSQSAPSGAGEVVQIVGVATHADRILFNPQLVQTEL